MKSPAALLTLAALLVVTVLAGCQTAKAPETVVQDESENVTVEESMESVSKEEVVINPNYDAKVDGDPTKTPTVEQDKEDGNANDSKAATTKVDQGFMSDPNQ